MTKIQLTNQLYHTWKTKANVSVIGYAWSDTKLLYDSSLTDYFIDCSNEEEFTLKLNRLSGHFSVIIETETCYLIAVDIIRTFPLFIGTAETGCVISDTVIPSGNLNTKACDHFQKIYCTPENETLLSNWQQLQAGEYAVVAKKDDSISIQTYFKHSSENSQPANAIQLKKAERKLAERIIAYAGERTILIPLSGGYDSRYLLTMLKENNCTNIICFTYGRKDSFEVTTAKTVAAALQVKWHFIEYTDELMDVFLTDSWNGYSNLNHRYTSLPHEQDFFALWYLKENDLLPHNAVVLNGFCQDILTGSFLENTQQFDIKKHIAYKHELKLDDTPYEDSWNGYQQWLVKNRLSKFIVNAVHVYEYFGLDFYLPFWDKDWVSYWYAVEFRDRLYQQFYTDYLFNGIFKKYSIAIPKTEGKKNSLNHIIRLFAKKILPKFIVDRIIQQQNQQVENDPNNTIYLYNKLYNALENKPKFKDFRINNIHVLYFLEKLKQNPQL
jgi:asparagine synthase (glutamine-hydrolysing)